MHSPMDFAQTLKLLFRVGDLGLPERRKVYRTSSRGEEKVEAQMCPWVKAVEDGTHMVGECEKYK